MDLAPIVLFVYNRLWHTKQTVEALKKNTLANESDLIVFSDGPKHDSSLDSIEEVRNFIKTIHGFKSVNIVEREDNLGLAESIITGVSNVLSQHDKIIVLEDDIVTSPFFLQYMNEGLDLYENDDRVISIHGYIYPTKKKLPETFFLRGADCWGWATWKRGWDLFEKESSYLLDQLKRNNLIHLFDFPEEAGFLKMLKNNISGKNNSWAIRWHASAFLKNKFTLYPGSSLVLNIGNDSSGTHCKTSEAFTTTLSNNRLKLSKEEVKESEEAKSAFKIFFQENTISPYKKLFSKLSKFFK
jgi:hypothetical protein